MQHVSKKKTFHRNLLLTLGGFAILYLTGLHSEVIGNLQRLLLHSSYFHPEVRLDSTHELPKDLNFQLMTLDNKLVDMNELKGKVIFLNFWATWSPPSIAEMPNIHSLFQKTKSDSIVYIMVAMDNNAKKVEEFIKRKGYTFPVYKLVNTVPGIFESPSIPTTFVICPEGKIVARKEGMGRYDNAQFIGSLRSLSKRKPMEVITQADTKVVGNID